MKKNGFTLAEILITLGIVGVVAALTTPALVKNSGQAKIGPSLAKFVNTFEVGMEEAMEKENVSSLSDLDDASFGGTIVMLPLNTAVTVNADDGTTETWDANKTRQLKDGTIIGYDPKKIQMSWSSNSSFKGSYKVIGLDIGGLKGKHRVGKEVFYFGIDKNGTLVPYGSKMHKYLQKSIKYNCSTKGSIYEAAACTGAIADNHWKADY
jgi:prepilin-type N-terminal cleavage/methylation domain-containing protein